MRRNVFGLVPLARRKADAGRLERPSLRRADWADRGSIVLSAVLGLALLHPLSRLGLLARAPLRLGHLGDERVARLQVRARVHRHHAALIIRPFVERLLQRVATRWDRRVSKTREREGGRNDAACGRRRLAAAPPLPARGPARALAARALLVVEAIVGVAPHAGEAFLAPRGGGAHGVRGKEEQTEREGGGGDRDGERERRLCTRREG
eukprot:6198874-Pleurochrysis_carterae.AAC.1